MKRLFIFIPLLCAAMLLLAACRFTSHGSFGQLPVQPTSPASSSQPGGPTSTDTTLGQPAGQIDQSLNDLESTLQAQDTGANSMDTGPLDQSLNDLESTLQAQDTGANSVDTGQIDQNLNDLEQVLQAEPTPEEHEPATPSPPSQSVGFFIGRSLSEVLDTILMDLMSLLSSS